MFLPNIVYLVGSFERFRAVYCSLSTIFGWIP